MKLAHTGMLFADDSGGEADELRSLAVLSGPSRVLLALERDLRKALRLYGVVEMKWTALRARPQRLQAALACLDLLNVGLEAGALRCDVQLWRPADQGPAYRRRSEPERLRPLYARAWAAAARSWGLPQWRAFPDQRTGMDWQHWSPSQQRAWRRARLRRLTVREASSGRSACIQLCDLLAGLCRQPALAAPAPAGFRRARHAQGAPGQRAQHNRQALLNHWILACASRRLPLGFKDGLLSARHPNLHIRLLRRLPVNA